ncbi:hypothetical protein ACFFX0_09220 [Citricoccus parietis]|uniref:Uncharacterized protein n=1 Tax=Citricoccus parietis TaxID=592307 RepID=A0ABV5FXK5_9MICC
MERRTRSLRETSSCSSRPEKAGTTPMARNIISPPRVAETVPIRAGDHPFGTTTTVASARRESSSRTSRPSPLNAVRLAVSSGPWRILATRDAHCPQRNPSASAKPSSVAWWEASESRRPQDLPSG